MKYTTEQRIAENRCDECEEVMTNEGHDYGGPVVCDACHKAILLKKAKDNGTLGPLEVDDFDD